MELLTIEMLDAMEPGTIFASGFFEDSPEAIHLARTGRVVPWIAKRGQIHDWTIYCQPLFGDSERGILWRHSQIAQWGDKVMGDSNIKKLVPCDDAAFSLYRF